MTTDSTTATTAINARIPAALAETLAQMAQDDDRSLSSMVAVALKRGVAVLLRDAERFPTAARSGGSGCDLPPPPNLPASDASPPSCGR